MAIQEEILADHQRTWRGFCWFMAIAAGIVVAILGLMGIFLL